MVLSTKEQNVSHLTFCSFVLIYVSEVNLSPFVPMPLVVHGKSALKNRNSRLAFYSIKYPM
jgi:hypothetical protein